MVLPSLKIMKIDLSCIRIERETEKSSLFHSRGELNPAIFLDISRQKVGQYFFLCYFSTARFSRKKKICAYVPFLDRNAEEEVKLREFAKTARLNTL